eukprot:657794-Rhodomonas_salina.1
MGAAATVGPYGSPMRCAVDVLQLLDTCADTTRYVCYDKIRVLLLNETPQLKREVDSGLSERVRVRVCVRVCICVC